MENAQFITELRGTSLVEAITSHLRIIPIALVGYVVLYLLWTVYLDYRTIPGFPVAGEKKWDFRRHRARTEFFHKGDQVVRSGLQQFKNNIFQVTGHSTPALILPIRYLDEIRNHPDLNMEGAALQDFFTHYGPPFSIVSEASKHHVVYDVVQKKLTPMLSLTTEPINEELNVALPQRWPEVKEWSENLMVPQLQLLVAQVSSRVFLGLPICRNPEWIKISADYTIQLVMAAFTLQYIPRPLRFIYPIIPAVRKLQHSINRARAIIDPEAKRRREDAVERRQKGEAPRKALDTIDWMLEISNDKAVPFDITSGQLGMTFAAIHTTSVTGSHMLYDIIERPDIMAEVRQEIIQVHKEEEGVWSKTSLYKLRLLDSIMKESQRFNMLGALPIQRYADKEVVLNDGSVIPKGTRLWVPALHQLSPEYHDDPETFDPKRYLKLRDQPGNGSKHQFVTTSEGQLGFGHGKHACPGRFFASNEIKLILVHLLMKYDWKFIDNKRPPLLPPHSGSKVIDPDFPILYKSRQSEIEI